MSLSISKLIRAMRLFGPLTGFLYAVDQLMIRSGTQYRIFYYDIMVQPVRTQSLLSANRGKSIVTREIPEGDPALTKIPPRQHVLSARFDQGAICLGAFRKDELIGYLWLTLDCYEEDEVRALFRPIPEPDTAFDFDVYLFPEHRFGLGFASLWDGANKYLAKRNIRYTCSRVSRFNPDSQSSHRRLESYAVGKLLFLSGKKRQLMIGTMSPFFHYSRSPQSRPIIRVPVRS